MISTMPLMPKDLYIAEAIQRECGREERTDVFLSMMKHYPKGCRLGLLSEMPAGYLFFHPYRKGEVKQKDKILEPRDLDDNLYIHDMAVRSGYRKIGIEKALMADFLLEAEHYPQQTVIAREGQQYFWAIYHFKVVEHIDYDGKKAFRMERKK